MEEEVILKEDEGQCIEYLERLSGIVLKPEQLRRLFVGRGYLVAELVEYGLDDDRTRESLACALALELLGRPWPTYAYSDEVFMRSFVKDLRVAAEGKGYKVNMDA